MIWDPVREGGQGRENRSHFRVNTPHVTHAFPKKQSDSSYPPHGSSWWRSALMCQPIYRPQFINLAQIYRILKSPRNGLLDTTIWMLCLKANRLAWLGHPIPSLPPNYWGPIPPCTPYNLCLKTPSQIPWPTSQSVREGWREKIRKKYGLLPNPPRTPKPKADNVSFFTVFLYQSFPLVYIVYIVYYRNILSRLQNSMFIEPGLSLNRRLKNEAELQMKLF